MGGKLEFALDVLNNEKTGVIKMLGNNNTTKELSEYTRYIREIAEEATTRARVTESFRALERSGKTTAQIADELEKIV